MYLKALTSALLIALPFGVIAAPKGYRLASSTAENMVVYVENATQDNWCAPRMEFIFLYEGDPDQTKHNQLMPKLGAFFQSQCSQAEQISWVSQDAAGNQIASGISSKSRNWSLEFDKPLDTSSETLVADLEAFTDHTKESTKQSPDTVAQAQDGYVNFGPASFDANGWKPEEQAVVIKNTPYIKHVTDQSGCGFYIATGSSDADLANLSIETSGFECINQLASGKGSFVMKRSDGHIVASRYDLYASNGFLFLAPMKEARLVKATKDGYLWFDLGYNEQYQSYHTYLLTTRTDQYFAPFSYHLVNPLIAIFTSNLENFQNADDISRQIDIALKHFDKVVDSNERNVWLYYSDDPIAGISRDDNGKIYNIKARASRATKNSPKSWQTDLSRADNFALKRLAAVAKQKEQEAERIALEQAITSDLADISSLKLDSSGWKALPHDEALKQASFLTTKHDQNNCQLIAYFNLDESVADVSINTSGFTCNQNNMLDGGKGVVEGVRSDGKVTFREEVFASNGFLVKAPLQHSRIIWSDKDHTLWFLLGMDKSKNAVFLLRGTVANRYSYSSISFQPYVDILLEDEEAFSDSQKITSLIDNALQAFQRAGIENANRAYIRVSKSINSLVEEDKNTMLYAIDAHRNTSLWGNDITSGWLYDLSRGKNYFIERLQAQQEAERRKQEEERQLKRRQLEEQIKSAENQLEQFEYYKKTADSNPSSLLYQLIDMPILDFSDINNSSLHKMYRGEAVPYKAVVHIRKVEGSEAVIDFPYDMRLIDLKNSSLTKGWYFISAKAQVDKSRLDNEGLVMTTLTHNADKTMKCEKDGCVDLTDPLTLMRISIGDPAWDPDEVSKMISEALKELE